MNELEAGVYNAGERLLPGVSHAVDELIRHTSSYELFRQAILKHMQAKNLKSAHILDLGCGSGWGSAYLSQIPGVKVTGVDIGKAPVQYARKYHKNSKINFFYADVIDYVKYMPAYDYIVSRNMVEHVPDGIELFKSLKWNEMLLVDVPYKEPEGANYYHLLHMVDESHFKDYEHPMFMYQELEGGIFKKSEDANNLNIMFILCQHDPVLNLDVFPDAIPAWSPRYNYDYYDHAKVNKIRRLFGNPLRVHT